MQQQSLSFKHQVVITLLAGASGLVCRGGWWRVSHAGGRRRKSLSPTLANAALLPGNRFNQDMTWPLVLFVLLTLALPTQAADPGTPIPSDAAVISQKIGSVLVYPFYTSNAAGLNTQNTAISITNTTSTMVAFVHLYFVDRSTAKVNDTYICLSASQTANFLASDVDPGVTGYLVGVAVDANGCPISFNFLAGDEYIKLAAGQTSKLNAEALAALYNGVLPGCSASSVSATLRFDGSSTGYNQLPRTLGCDFLASRADGNNTILILTRIGGNYLATTSGTVGAVSGKLFDDQPVTYSFSFSSSAVQFQATLNNSFPLLTPGFETIIARGRTGWLKLWATSDYGLFGVLLNFNANEATTPAAFTNGQLLQKLTLATSDSMTIPVFPPSC